LRCDINQVANLFWNSVILADVVYVWRRGVTDVAIYTWILDVLCVLWSDTNCLSVFTARGVHNAS
jgi:hypothetical protein